MVANHNASYNANPLPVLLQIPQILQIRHELFARMPLHQTLCIPHHRCKWQRLLVRCCLADTRYTCQYCQGLECLRDWNLKMKSMIQLICRNTSVDDFAIPCPQH